MNKVKLIFATLIFSCSFGFSQNTEQEILQEANLYFDEGDYFSAANAYARILNEASNAPLDISYKYAESLRLYNSYPEAAHWYLYVNRLDSSNLFPESAYWYAMMEKQTGNYDLSIRYLTQYLDGKGNLKHVERAKREIQSCTQAKRIVQDTMPVTVEHLGANINTPYSEFGAIQLADTALYFSSLRRIVAEEEGSILPGVFVSKVFRSKMSIAGLSTAKEYKNAVNDPKTNNGNITFSADKTKLYFTRCTNTSTRPNCEIWMSEKEKDKWKKPERLNRRINFPGSTNTQPSYESGEDFDVLYFASDRPGGFGGMDLWYSIVKQGKYADPVNLGSNINTIGDEITPFYHTSDSTLYFSSDTHEGIGGFDIFSAKGGLNQWLKPLNMGIPLNSTANDIYFSVNEIDNDGYLTSNRSGSFYLKGETCCNDIYYYEWKKDRPIATLSQDTLFIDTTNIEQRIREILPLTLYFHNDEPDPATTKTTTDKNYKTTLANYFALKELYSDEYAKGLSGNDAIKARKDIDDFFNDYVKKGFSDLELFSKWLLEDLEQGNQVKITIKGYTSPLHTAEYNMKLAMRRISSLKNYIYEYRDSIFNPYTSGCSKSGARLELYDAPIGKTEANIMVSDNPNDIRNSVYSRAAALERRIQIVMYESGKTKVATDTLAKLSLPSNEINIGKLGKTETKRITVQYQNRGIGLLKIDSIIVSSHAVDVQFNRDAVAKNGTGFITFTLYGADLNVDQLTVEIISNAPKNGYLKIKLH